VDSYQAHLESFRRALSKFGLSVEDTEIYRRFGKPAKQMLTEILPEKEHRHIDEIVKEKRIAFIQTSREVRVYEGVEETLRYLRLKGLKLCLATSADKLSVLRVLKEFSLEGHFDLILSADDVEEAKPNPEIFILASERLGVEPNDCLIVGDSIYDVTAARKAGINVIAVANNPFQMEAIKGEGVSFISRITEMKEFL
jgi:beta-phosphoglucomutase